MGRAATLRAMNSERGGNAQIVFASGRPAAMTAAEVRFRDKALVFPFIRDIEAEGDHIAQVLVVPLAVAVFFASHLLVGHFLHSFIESTACP